MTLDNLKIPELNLKRTLTTADDDEKTKKVTTSPSSSLPASNPPLKCQHIIIQSKPFSNEKIQRYEKFGKTLVFSSIYSPYPWKEYENFDYILLDISNDSCLKWFEINFNNIPEYVEITGVVNKLEKYELNENDKDNWINFCDNVLDHIPQEQPFKHLFDGEHTKKKCVCQSTAYTLASCLCGLLGLKKP